MAASEAQKAGLQAYWDRWRAERAASEQSGQEIPKRDKTASLREAIEMKANQTLRERELRDSDAPLTFDELRMAGLSVRSRRGRVDPKLSQDDLAALLAITPWEVALLERGRYPFGHMFLARLVKIFGVMSGSDLMHRGAGDIGRHAIPASAPETAEYPRFK